MIRIQTALLSATIILGGLLPWSEAHAQGNLFSSPSSNYFKANSSIDRYNTSQYRNQVFNSALPQNLQTGSARNSIFSGSNSSLGTASKPFANVRPQSNLSPYLNLGGLPAGGATNYHSLVRPQLEQQQRTQQRRNVNQARDAQSVAARAPYELRGATDLRPTGHSAVYQNLGGRFQNYGGYYQGPRLR